MGQWQVKNATIAIATEIQPFPLNKYSWIIPILWLISRALKKLTVVSTAFIVEGIQRVLILSFLNSLRHSCL